MARAPTLTAHGQGQRTDAGNSNIPNDYPLREQHVAIAALLRCWVPKAQCQLGAMRSVPSPELFWMAQVARAGLGFVYAFPKSGR